MWWLKVNETTATKNGQRIRLCRVIFGIAGSVVVTGVYARFLHELFIFDRKYVLHTLLLLEAEPMLLIITSETIFFVCVDFECLSDMLYCFRRIIIAICVCVYVS